LVAQLLLFLREGGDKCFGQFIALAEERIFFSHLLLDEFRHTLAVALGRESV
jgi:hypothetical protein